MIYIHVIRMSILKATCFKIKVFFVFLRVPLLVNICITVTITMMPSMQSRSGDQNVPLSFHCFENPTVLQGE